MPSAARLLELQSCGQSYWIDDLSRAMIRSGELERRVREEGLRGMTSNPAIFHKAITGGDDYDEQIHELAERRLDVREIYERIVVTDVQNACDILRPVYVESGGADGFVSLEVSPHLAHAPGATMIEVKRLFAAVDRPNVMIKIPGTAAGVPAIEEMLYEGININITLLFSIAQYQAVARAFLSAMERRASEGKPVTGVASVASFFLSRIDVLTDELLGQRILPEGSPDYDPHPRELLGQAAIASARMAYRAFKRLFRGSRWKSLVNTGARVQRPLWASTSTKNPDYPDVKYVEPLIGRHTVSTMPEKTIAAFADHGVVRPDAIEDDGEQARRVVKTLKDIGVDLDRVCWQLQNEGIQKFITPYDDLLAALSEKCRERRPVPAG